MSNVLPPELAQTAASSAGVVSNGQRLHEDKPPVRMQRLAWGVIVVSFAVFCLICVLSTLGLYSFLFESSTSLSALVQAGRGTVLVTDADFNVQGVQGRDSAVITSRRATISTDGQSQAEISFSEPINGTSIELITLTLRNNTGAQLVRADKPRFSWSLRGHQVFLDRFTGQMDVVILPSTGENVVVSVQDVSGGYVSMIAPGRYTLDATDSRTRVAVRAGRAVMSNSDSSGVRLIDSGREGALYTARSEPVAVPNPNQNLLSNGQFTFADPAIPRFESSTEELPSWDCTAIQESGPTSIYGYDSWQGRQALRFRRADGADSNGRTSCVQRFPGEGLDIRDFRYLELETVLLINFQSLSKCGTVGSECPVMLRLRYESEDGTVEEWIQGFYYADDPVRRDFPSRCVNCLGGIGDHRQINEKVWYTYNSGNLLTALTAAGYPMPVTIQEVEFYASGHQYDVFFSEIGLYAGFPEVIPPEVAPNVPEPSPEAEASQVS